MIRKTSIFLTDLLCGNSIIRPDDRETYEYGFQITMANIFNLIIVLTIGIVSGSLPEAVTFYFVFVSLRIFCGGFHASTYTRCFCLFGSVCVMTLAGSKLLVYGGDIWLPLILAFVIQGVCIYKMAPIEHSNHPLFGEERKLFRKKSIQMYAFWIAASLVFAVFGKDNILMVIAMSLISVSILMIKAIQAGGEKQDEEEMSGNFS